MDQGTARKRAAELDGVAVEARRSSGNRRWIIGGWASQPGSTWIVVTQDRKEILSDDDATVSDEEQEEEYVMALQTCRRHPNAAPFMRTCSGCAQDLYDTEARNRAQAAQVPVIFTLAVDMPLLPEAMERLIAEAESDTHCGVQVYLAEGPSPSGAGIVVDLVGTYNQLAGWLWLHYAQDRFLGDASIRGTVAEEVNLVLSDATPMEG